MPLFLTEQEVAELLTMEQAIEAVQSAFKHIGSGHATNNPRSRIRGPKGTLHLMSGALLDSGAMGFKAYTVFRGGARFLFLLYSAESGDLLALIEADKLGQMRTGAASGVATKFMAREDATTVGIFGTGWQARSQLMAVCAVRPIRFVGAYGRNAGRRDAFCQEMSEQLQVEVQSVARPEEVLEGADIVITATSSREPVFSGEYVRPGVHINAVGSNALIRRELDEVAVERSELIVVDSKEQAKIEAGDFLPLIERGRLCWEQVHELGEVVVARVKGRQTADQITLFKSLGVAIEDVAVGLRVYENAKQAGLGRAL
jgi:ornithine cyclodeaminase/alanine dehydrogenase-like protein (mu-crystallin family)